MSDEYDIETTDPSDPYTDEGYTSEDPYMANSPPTMSMDLDGDGFAETTMLDQNADGLVDTVVEVDAATGAMAVGVDTDGDGMLDTLAVDYDGDGIIDEALVDGDYQNGAGDPIDDPVDDPIDDPADDPTTTFDDGPFNSDDPTLDPTDPVVDEGMHGDPMADIDYHQVQPGPVDCLPTSVSMVISEITGTDVPADELVQLANDSGFMMESGMSAENAASLLENYGVESTLSSGTVDDLRDALDSGDPIIVGIDSADVYNGGGGPFDPGMEAGHAVVITGIDDGPPGMVYINDPGFPDGAGVAIEMDMFIDAWEDSDNTMVIAEVGADSADATVGAVAGEPAAATETTTYDGVLEDVRRLILLPLNFVLKS